MANVKVFKDGKFSDIDYDKIVITESNDVKILNKGILIAQFTVKEVNINYS